MTSLMRGAAALVLAAATTLAAGHALAQDKKTLATDRERVSYMVGMDIGRSFEAVGPDVDFAAFERAVRNAFDGGQPLVDEREMAAVMPALVQRAAVRSGKPIPGLAPGSEPPSSVDTAKVGLILGADAGRALVSLKDDLDVPVLVQAVRTVALKQQPLLTPEETAQIAGVLTAQIKARTDAKREQNKQEGAAFLATNKTTKGVFSTPSGLQYMVLRQGAGRRPMASDRVRVHYRGTLLDGTVFDSSYDRNAPADFGLGQVIAGWTEGLTLMPIGAKYRFWIPGELAYGEAGSPPTIGPNSTLVFDVELLDIL